MKLFRRQFLILVYHTGYVASRSRIALSNSRLQRARTVRNDNRYSACVFVCCNSGVERIEAAQRAEASAELIADAVALVAKWNADIERRKDSQYGYADRARLPQFSPHIGAAILAKKSWLRLLCPACQQQGAVDLRKMVRPADYPIDGLYDALTCTFGPCRGDGPRPVMLGLFASRADPAA